MNALELAKIFEPLKNASLGFHSQKGSFSDKLNAATLRLDRNLVEHWTQDTLFFGAKVSSSPGCLGTKITNVDNNVIDCKRTLTLQSSYALAMMTGSVNQAKRVVGKYDEVLS